MGWADEDVLRRVRWGNVARLAGVVGAALLIAFGGRGCGGSEPERIPLDPLPGEPLGEAGPPLGDAGPPPWGQSADAARPRGTARPGRRRTNPVARAPSRRCARAARRGLRREALGSARLSLRPSAPPGRSRVPEPSPTAPVPERAREFSFDR